MENLGLVGFTGAGANRLFSALTGIPVPSEYEAAVGVATVPDERVDRLAVMSKSKNVVHAGFELVHLALPPGAKPGEGLGAKLLGALRNCDAVLVVLRAFADGGVEPDPAGDLDALELELVLADLTSVEQRLDRQRRQAKSGDKEIAAEVAALERAHAVLSDGTPLRRSDLSADELARLAPVFCLTVKPTLVVLNTGEKVDADAAPEEGALAGAIRVPIDIEAEIAACAPEDRDEMREMYGVGESALSTVARAAYHLHDRRGRIARVDVPRRREGARVRGRDPQRPPARLHPRRGDRLGGAAGDRLVVEGAGGRQVARRGQGLRSPRRRRARDPLQRVARGRTRCPGSCTATKWSRPPKWR
jgi:ribosome-binding ATPase YchF (GTP1/OBG family)